MITGEPVTDVLVQIVLVLVIILLAIPVLAILGFVWLVIVSILASIIGAILE